VNHAQDARATTKLTHYLAVQTAYQNKRAWYSSFMIEVSPSKELSVKTIRDGDAEPFDDEWNKSSPEERIEAVWTLTRLCLAWNNHLTDEPRLQRTITRIQRASR